MIYVVEGLDRCGKSTFINELKSKLNNPFIIHCGKPPEHLKNNYYYNLYFYTDLLLMCINENNYGRDVILDRSWIGETVYGPLYRDVNIPLSSLEKHLPYNFDDICLIMFTDSPSRLIEREDGESHSSDIESKIKEIDLFHSAFNNTKIKNKMDISWEFIEFSPFTISDLCNSVISKFNKVEKSA